MAKYDTIFVFTGTEKHVYEDSCWIAKDNGYLVLEDKDSGAHTIYAPGEWKQVTFYSHDVEGKDAFAEIGEFMRAGNQIVPHKPSSGVPVGVSSFIARVREEVKETSDAYFRNHQAEAVDGFLDTAYVAITGAIRIAGVEKARECWEAIMRANTSKIDGTYGEKVTDPSTGKILKPEGWVAPDIEGILGRD